MRVYITKIILVIAALLALAITLLWGESDSLGPVLIHKSLLFIPSAEAASPGQPPDADDDFLCKITYQFNGSAVSGLVQDQTYAGSTAECSDELEASVCAQWQGLWGANYSAVNPGYSVGDWPNTRNSSQELICRLERINPQGQGFNVTAQTLPQTHVDIPECPPGQVYNTYTNQCQPECPTELYKYYNDPDPPTMPPGNYCKAKDGGYCFVKVSLLIQVGGTSTYNRSVSYTGQFCGEANFTPPGVGSTSGPTDANDDPVPTATQTDNPDGTITTTNPDGSTTTSGNNGPTTTVSADGGTTTTTSADGTSTTTTGPNGTTTTTNQPGGGTITENPDGSITTTDAQGNASTVDADGYQVENPDGTNGGLGSGAGSQIGDCTNWIYNPGTGNFQCIDGQDPIDPGDGTDCYDDVQTAENECDPSEGDDGVSDDGSTSYTGCDAEPECDESDDWKCVQTKLAWENRCLYEWDGTDVSASSILDNAGVDDGSSLFGEIDLSTLQLDDSGFINNAEPETIIQFNLPIFGTYELNLSALYQIITYLGYIIAALGYWHAARIVIEAL